MATIYHLLILLSIFLLSPCSKVEGVRFQNSSGVGAGHVPEYTVTISNIGHSPVSGVHVSCGEFSSASLINPKIFRRLTIGDCLVKDGGVIPIAETVSFIRTFLLINSLFLQLNAFDNN